jgi:hypothetical protein
MAIMTSFDEPQHPRHGRTGRFAQAHHSAPELAIGRSEIASLPGGEARPPVDPRIDREDVTEVKRGRLAVFDEYIDPLVFSVQDGKLSRGVAGRERVAATRAWIRDADSLASHDEEAAEFRDGMRRGVAALYYEHLDYDGSIQDLEGPELERVSEQALTVAETKRASIPEREFWRQQLTSMGEAEWRGSLVVGATLSDTDRWWGFRDHADTVISER